MPRSKSKLTRKVATANEPAENTSLLVSGIVAVVALVTGLELDPGEVAAAVVGVGVVAKVVTKVVDAARARYFDRP